MLAKPCSCSPNKNFAMKKINNLKTIRRQFKSKKEQYRYEKSVNSESNAIKYVVIRLWNKNNGT